MLSLFQLINSVNLTDFFPYKNFMIHDILNWLKKMCVLFEYSLKDENSKSIVFKIEEFLCSYEIHPTESREIRNHRKSLIPLENFPKLIIRHFEMFNKISMLGHHKVVFHTFIVGLNKNIKTNMKLLYIYSNLNENGVT